ncbi:MAG TPA: hypothetical protein VI999_03600 [Thermoplasmata archaeon]|nr:hypothetical protein [Thermoplasmata archaeon]
MGYMGENRVWSLVVEHERPTGTVVEVRGLPIEDPSLACLRRWLAGDDDSLSEWLDDREASSLEGVVRRLDEWELRTAEREREMQELKSELKSLRRQVESGEP